MTHPFHLEPYRPGGHNRYTCPQCGRPRCFTRYVNTATGEYIDDTCGKCDHESSCGYHYPPSAYFRDHAAMRPTAMPLRSPSPSPWQQPSIRPSPPSPPRPIDTIPPDYVRRSLSGRSEFSTWLATLFPDPAALRQAMLDYRLGATRDGAAIFWQIDTEGRVRSGKIMHYSPDGHRQGTPCWTHALLKKQHLLPPDWQLTQCLFGQHLLTRTDKPVCLVESEKTAIICSLRWPDHLWIATGGCKQLSPEKCLALRGRQVKIFPDSGEHDEWARKMKETEGFRYAITDMMESLPRNTDLADIVVKEMAARREATEASGQKRAKEGKRDTSP